MVELMEKERERALSQYQPRSVQDEENYLAELRVLFSLVSDSLVTMFDQACSR